MTIQKGLIGQEDINFGTGTFLRTGKSGAEIPITKVDASSIPIVDTLGKFTGTDVEAALEECITIGGGGGTIGLYTNNSGAQRVLGEVVVVDTTVSGAFTTTTTSGNTKVLGIVAETIAAAATGQVITNGYIGTLQVTSATNRGDFLRTSTTAGKCVSSSTFQSGVFALSLSTTAGAGNVQAVIFGGLGGQFLLLTGGNLSGLLGLAKGADIPSASTLTLGTDGNYFDVTGTSGITSIATTGNVGTVVGLHFDGALTITHHATNLILPRGVNLTTAAGTELILVEYASGQWRVISWVDAAGTGTGKQVFQNSPVLISPSIDTFTEATPDNGITIDGLRIRDGRLNGMGANYKLVTNTGGESWTSPRGVTNVTALLVGGGGGGASGGAGSGPSNYGSGGGGGGAGETRLFSLTVVAETSYTITAGAGGGGGAAVAINNTGNAGGNGSASTFGGLASVAGGSGGAAAAGTSGSAGGSGGNSASGGSGGGGGGAGTSNTSGNGGSGGSQTGGNTGGGGAGGGNPYGRGGAGGNGGGSSGSAAVGYGCGGGGGGGNYGGGNSGAGAAGTQGFVLFWW